MNRVKRALKKTFLAGLVIVVPIVITGLALYWLFRLLDGILSPFFYQVLGWEIAGLGLLTELILIFLIGILATNVLGSRFLKFFQSFLMRLPVVKNIYPAIRQMVEAFSSSGHSPFRKVVLVEYPQKGIFSLGFLTREVSLELGGQGSEFLSVYIPTNNLYLGQVGLFRADEVVITDLTVEEALKIILSGGTAFPPSIKSQPKK
jgi:uncharacterized membrane protein